MKRDPMMSKFDIELNHRYKLICVGTDADTDEKPYAVEFEIKPALPRKWGFECEMNGGGWTIELQRRVGDPMSESAHLHFPVLKKGDRLNLAQKVLGLLKLTGAIK